MNLVTPTDAAKYELLFNKASENGLLNKSSCLPQALGATKLIIATDMILVTSHFVLLLKSHLDVQQTHLRAPDFMVSI